MSKTRNRPETGSKGEAGKGRPRVDRGVLGRVFGMLIRAYPVLVPVAAFCIIFNAVCSVMPAVFQQKVLALIEVHWQSGDWEAASGEIVPLVLVLVGFYVLSIAASTASRQLMAVITQGFLSKVRRRMFDSMQNLPIKYFDTHRHGDIMSVYTNDTDALREFISHALPQMLASGIIVLGVFGVMIWYSVWLALVVVAGVAAMIFVSRKLGGGSAKYFVRQQKSTGATEGFIQEMMSGQKVVKVFNHEDRALADFKKTNDRLYEDSFRAHAYANTLGPVIMNIGNLLYVIIATVGGALLLARVPNPSVRGLIAGAGLGAVTIDVLLPFLNMTKQFTGNVNQLSQQVNAIAMASAGAGRIFALMDEQPETDDGYVKLVDAEIGPDGSVTEADHRTGHWAWKFFNDTATTEIYTELRGEVTMNDVDFAYTEGKQMLFDVSVYAYPGQKVAFVGATGAGKTTITNLINRFYDIADGKIRYDGINVNKIRKSDLRRSLGIVLQDTNLFTGTVMDNIRYGRLDATDAECVEAAKLAGADDFITRLPEGYSTELSNNGSNLSQGQRQLIAIARCAVADPPVMILDEATSSIDTRTEAIVQKGMDKLMEGRTTFVIAHRLSTVRNADVIMVLDHGRIIERGSHEKLIAEKGTYYKLYKGVFELE